jgi:anaerobic ribonucleoside-triphosphate reductase
MQKISDKIGDHQFAKISVNCMDCGIDFVLDVERISESEIKINNGAIGVKKKDCLFKCSNCFEEIPSFGEKTEVYSRVVGYLRPICQWNEAKRNEFTLRKEFII